MFFIHSAILIGVAIVVVFAWRRGSKRRRNRSALYDPTLVLFTLFSSLSWIPWGLQYVILVAGPFTSFASVYFPNIGLWLALMQNALWATALVSLHSIQFAKKRVTLPLLLMLSILAAVFASQRTTLTELYIYFENVLAASIFWAFAYSVLQLRLRKISAVIFFIHGCTQWIWRDLWSSPLPASTEVLSVFVFWHLVLLVAWSISIFEVMGIFRVMISSTLRDLNDEREAVDQTIRRLNLGRIESFARFSDNPERTCAFWAAHCDIFILLIGERYGSIVESRQISFVQFEYSVAYDEDRGKILIYEKEGVTREPELEEFVDRLNEVARLGGFESGHIKSSFTTVNDLSQQVEQDVPRWLASRQALTR